MFQMQIPLGQLPINLVLLSDGTLVFIRVANFGVIFDQPENGVGAIFHEDSFTISGEEFFYNTIYDYKEYPDMLVWLQQQNLQWPEMTF